MIPERFRVTDKVVLVVGGRGTLGRRIARATADAGALVYAADLAGTAPAAVQDPPARRAGVVLDKSVDVTDPDSVDTLVAEVVREASRIDVLVYSATTKSPGFYAPFVDFSLKAWRTVLEVELDGLFLVARSVGRFMESANGGSIILLSSIYGIVGNDQRIYANSNLARLHGEGGPAEPGRIFSPAAYAAAKGAVISLTRYLAAYWGDRNIRVNCISPGGLSHPEEDDEFVRRYSERVPLGRKADPDEIGGAAVFLASDAASYVTGHNLVVDGGWTAW
jgi:NAD(P)-dependent dehydrogenase (short-subunit alcohol dehydrogenase family)